jgi:hypothetical protein
MLFTIRLSYRLAAMPDFCDDEIAAVGLKEHAPVAGP